MEVKGDRERIKASWVSISRVEASREDSSGSEGGDRRRGRPCIPLASQKQRWNHWKAHTSRNKARRRRRMFLIVSLAIFIRRGFICQLVAPLPLFFLTVAPSVCLSLCTAGMPDTCECWDCLVSCRAASLRPPEGGSQHHQEPISG